jgi:hypothetical protein
MIEPKSLTLNGALEQRTSFSLVENPASSLRRSTPRYRKQTRDRSLRFFFCQVMHLRLIFFFMVGPCPILLGSAVCPVTFQGCVDVEPGLQPLQGVQRIFGAWFWWRPWLARIQVPNSFNKKREK